MIDRNRLQLLIERHLSAWIPADLNVLGAFPTAARQDARELTDAIIAMIEGIALSSEEREKP